MNTPTASLQRDKKKTDECPDDDIKQSNGKFQVMLEFWGMRGTISLSSLLGQSGSMSSSYLWVK